MWFECWASSLILSNKSGELKFHLHGMNALAQDHFLIVSLLSWNTPFAFLYRRWFHGRILLSKSEVGDDSFITEVHFNMVLIFSRRCFGGSQCPSGRNHIQRYHTWLCWFCKDYIWRFALWSACFFSFLLSSGHEKFRHFRWT